METIGAKAWLAQTLLAYAPLTALVGQRIYDESASDDAVFPYVTFGINSNSDINVIGTNPVLANSVTFTIKAVTDEGRSFEQAGRIARQIHAALQNQSGSVIDDGITYHIQGCMRTQIVQFPEYANGKQFSHFGGMYYLMVDE